MANAPGDWSSSTKDPLNDGCGSPSTKTQAAESSSAGSANNASKKQDLFGDCSPSMKTQASESSGAGSGNSTSKKQAL